MIDTIIDKSVHSHTISVHIITYTYKVALQDEKKLIINNYAISGTERKIGKSLEGVPT